MPNQPRRNAPDIAARINTTLPRPRPCRAGAVKASFWAVIALAALACATFWLTRAPEDKTALRQQAAAAVNKFLAQTPLAGMGGLIGNDPPPPPPEVLRPQTDRGTLAGREIVGAIAAPMDFGPILPRQTAQNPQPEQQPKSALASIKDAALEVATMFGAAPQQESPPITFSQDTIPPVKEDSTVRPSHLASLAQWLVNHYRPGPNGGHLGASVQALNQECGGRLARDAQGGRSSLLRYALQPSMIDALYRLYIDRFMLDLNAAAARKGLTPEQNRDFHIALAGRAALIALSLDAVLRTPNLPGSLAQIDKLAQTAVDDNVALTNAVFELDELKNDSPEARAIAQQRVNDASARYRRAAAAYAAAQSRLAQNIRSRCGPGLDDEALLFMAAWVGRRETAGPQAKAALERCVQALHDLATRCKTAGG